MKLLKQFFENWKIKTTRNYMINNPKKFNTTATIWFSVN